MNKNVFLFLDRQPPNLFLTSKNPPKTSNPKYTLTWNTNEQANFKCTLNGRIVDCGDGTSGKYTTPNLPDGRNTFEVHAVDTVGNKGRPRIVTWVTGMDIIGQFYVSQMYEGSGVGGAS